MTATAAAQVDAMATAIKKALRSLFDDAARTKSAMSRLLNPSAEGPGGRVYPARSQKNDQLYGIRIDRGELVRGKPGFLRLKLQINSNAASKTLRDIAAKDSHQVVSEVDVDTNQDVTKENLEKIQQDFIDNLRL
ncbi:hypothetical protein PITC_036860 [Penicillium italicum]|uniref:Uncharacterized protein n=1 Tax=Penicillium italicum TaxID=40296 RepID=A0A0A2LIC0_PENIT|nr:hypothetical protein PITC_036860 [Penicillium italicum]